MLVSKNQINDFFIYWMEIVQVGLVILYNLQLLHLLMTAWLLQAVVLPPLSLKPKDLKSKPQFELKIKKKKRIGLFAVKEKDGDTLLIVHQKIYYIG